MNSIPGNRVDALTPAHAVGDTSQSSRLGNGGPSDNDPVREKTLVVIEPVQSRGITKFKALWNYRELICYLQFAATRNFRAYEPGIPDGAAQLGPEIAR